MAVSKIGGDEWDQIPDDELEETIAERLWGLREMFPDAFRCKLESSVDWSIWAAKHAVDFFLLCFEHICNVFHMRNICCLLNLACMLKDKCNAVFSNVKLFQFSFVKSALWIVSSSMMILILPYVIEKERSEYEKSQVHFSFAFYVIEVV